MGKKKLDAFALILSFSEKSTAESLGTRIARINTNYTDFFELVIFGK